jgi:hypothetical protein
MRWEYPVDPPPVWKAAETVEMPPPPLKLKIKLKAFAGMAS